MSCSEYSLLYLMFSDRRRSDATERGIRSGSALFAAHTAILDTLQVELFKFNKDKYVYGSSLQMSVYQENIFYNFFMKRYIVGTH